MIERILRGMTVDTETLGLECIERVGPGGNYVLDDHTVQHMFNEFYYPHLAVRGQYDRWTELGSPTPLTRAQKLVNEYLDAAQARLDQETVAGIRRRFPDIVELEPK
jgi:trimethylamine--corrinoid protein Co-methyltransferase